jgi:hypothetical protein
MNALADFMAMGKEYLNSIDRDRQRMDLESLLLYASEKLLHLSSPRAFERDGYESTLHVQES